MSNLVEQEPVNESYQTLLKAFQTFQSHSDALEQNHLELKSQLETAQLDLAERNEQLKHKVAEVEDIKSRLAAILETIDDAVFLIDADGNCEASNKAAGDFIAKINGDLLDLSPEISKRLQAKKRVSNYEFTCRIEQEEVSILLNVLPLKDSQESFFVVILKDITDYRQLQERVEREGRLSELGQVAASVAHEIRNPLAAIEGFARLLERDLADVEASMAGKIVKASRQLNYVVTNLLTYTKEQGMQVFPYDLKSTVEEAADLVIPMADDRSIIFNMDLEEGISLDIDSAQIKQLLLNLFINSVQACPVKSDGEIQVSLYRQKKEIVIDVQDNGCGIPQSKIDKLFEPFFTMKDGGIGLGLAMCQRIADSHHGLLSVESEEGKWTKFTLTLQDLKEEL